MTTTQETKISNSPEEKTKRTIRPRVLKSEYGMDSIYNRFNNCDMTLGFSFS